LDEGEEEAEEDAAYEENEEPGEEYADLGGFTRLGSLHSGSQSDQIVPAYAWGGQPTTKGISYVQALTGRAPPPPPVGERVWKKKNIPIKITLGRTPCRHGHTACRNRFHALTRVDEECEELETIESSSYLGHFGAKSDGGQPPVTTGSRHHDQCLHTISERRAPGSRSGGQPSGISGGKRANQARFVKLQVLGDSGAADCVIPKKLFQEIPVNTNTPKFGMKYTAAGGKPIYNEGVRTVVGEDSEGHKRRVDFQVADVNKPLASLRRIVEKNHRVVLDDIGDSHGYIEDKGTGKRTPLYVEHGVYVFDLWVDVGASAVFARPGSSQ